MSAAIDYLQMFREGHQVFQTHTNSSNSANSTPIEANEAIEAPPEDINTPSEEFEERAAIVEFDAGVPREWAEGFARLCTMPRHPDFKEPAWQQLIDDAGRFLDSWAVQVSAMGWTVKEVFGVDGKRPYARIDQMGLVLCIGGREVIAVSSNSVTIQSSSGNHQRIFRRPDEQWQGRVPVWDIKQELG